MKKSNRVESWVEESGVVSIGGLDKLYLAYFECFNKLLYYEAHDVLEQLWLREKRQGGQNADFFKGLIQLAGAYVHLKKQYARPLHVKDGRRARPAARLFRLAGQHLALFAPSGGEGEGAPSPLYMALNVGDVCRFCEEQAFAIECSGFACNPWSPEMAPELSLHVVEGGQPKGLL